MAGHDVFISYARSAAARAERLERALSQEGFAVWRDTELPGNRPFADVIEERIRSSRAVLVLWSADAAKSQWVRAEADLARHLETLVQLRLDHSEPPMPFNQTHCLDFSDWRGARTGADWRKLVETLEELRARQQPAGEVEPAREAVHPAPLGRVRRHVRPLALAAGVAVLALAGLAWWAQGRRPAAGHDGRIEVAQFSTPPSDPDLQQPATEISQTLIRILSGGGVPTTLASEAGAGADRPELRIGGALDRDGRDYVFNSQLTEAATGEVLWSWRFDGAGKPASDFVGDVAAVYSAVLHCALEDRKTAKTPISTTAFGLYLNACAVIFLDQEPSRMLAVTRQLAAAAPDFAAAHAMHAIAAGKVVEDEEHSDQDIAAIRAEGRTAVDRAIALDRTFAKTYVGSALLRERTDYLNQERDLKTALRYAPDLPPPRYLLGWLLLKVGRLREAAEERASTAATADPRVGLSAYAQAALSWAAAGEPGKAEQALSQLQSGLPGMARSVRWELALWSDDPKTAIADLRRNGGEVDPAARACAEAFVVRLAKTGSAPLTGLPAECGASPPERRIRMLAREGDVDGAYRELGPLAQRRDFEPDLLFYAQMKGVRADPRFAPLAARLGLLTYWKSSGHEPDFCAGADRPAVCAQVPSSP
jgi:hypothetical protein